MGVSDKDLDDLRAISKRIHRVRALLGDQVSAPGYIVKKKGAQRTLFRERIKTLRRLEAQRARLVLDAASRATGQLVVSRSLSPHQE